MKTNLNLTLRSLNGLWVGDTFMPPFEHLYNKQEVVKEFDGHKVIKYSK